jgi:predicted ATP-dependent endonuclease of OLD family
MTPKLRRLRLSNWRNFGSLNVSLGDRMFVVAPNASDKTNVLDAFRLLRAIADRNDPSLLEQMHRVHAASEVA